MALLSTKRLVAMCLVLAAIAGGLLAATVTLAVIPGSSSASEVHSIRVHPTAKTAPTARHRATGRTLSGFAASLQDYAATAEAAFGGARLVVRDCIESGDGTAFCAYTVQGVCRGAMLTEQPITIKRAGKVGLSASDCTARHALKWIGANR